LQLPNFVKVKQGLVLSLASLTSRCSARTRAIADRRSGAAGRQGTGRLSAGSLAKTGSHSRLAQAARSRWR
jgi:hypothetical protein